MLCSKRSLVWRLTSPVEENCWGKLYDNFFGQSQASLVCHLGKLNKSFKPNVGQVCSFLSQFEQLVFLQILEKALPAL